jgi:hypothetical protein
MGLIPFPTFGSVVAGASAALDRRLQRPAVKDRSGRHFLPSFGDPEHSFSKRGWLEAQKLSGVVNRIGGQYPSLLSNLLDLQSLRNMFVIE